MEPIPKSNEGLDETRISELMTAVLRPIHANYLRGPLSQARALEALNALAAAVALIVDGCDDPSGDPLKFFHAGLEKHLGTFKAQLKHEN